MFKSVSSYSKPEANASYLNELLFHEEEKIKSLYKFVIIQAFIDYNCRGVNRRVKGMRQRAHDWIMDDNEGFFSVCSMAEISPRVVRENFKKFKKGRMKIVDIIKFC